MSPRNDCPECARSNGPHYIGPCEHGSIKARTRKPRSKVRALVPSNLTASLFGIERIEISALSVTLFELGNRQTTVPRSKISEAAIGAENVYTLADEVRAVRS